MSIVVIDSGKKAFLDLLTGVGGENLVGSQAHLFVNNHVPVHNDTLAAYTEAAFAGYAAQLLAGWGGSALDGTFHAFSTALLVAFSNTSAIAQSVFGYYVTDILGTTLFFAEQFAGAPIAIPAAQALGLAVTFTQTSEF